MQARVPKTPGTRPSFVRHTFAATLRLVTVASRRRFPWFAIIVSLPIGAILLLVLYIVAWFNAGVLYAGDGTYRRNQGAATFQVRFPPADLTRSRRYVYEFTRLGPPMKYYVGLRVPGAERPQATVLMQLQNEKGETVFRHSRSLQDWDWLHDLATINGKIVEVPGPDFVQITPLGVGPDGGWGTSFEPRFFGRYTLVIDVEPVHSGSQPLLVHPVIEAYTALP